MSSKYQKYIKKIGLKGVKALAKNVGVHYIYLYRIATPNTKNKPSPELAIRIHIATQGEITCFDLLASKAKKIWPSTMFTYHEEWKKK